MSAGASNTGDRRVLREARTEAAELLISDVVVSSSSRAMNVLGASG